MAASWMTAAGDNFFNLTGRPVLFLAISAASMSVALIFTAAETS